VETENKRPAWTEISHLNSEVKRYWSQWNCIVLINKLLYSKWSNNDGTHYWQFIVPKNYRNNVLYLIHNHKTAAHLGFTKSKMKLQRLFYWVNCSNDVELCCNSCETCQSRKLPQTRAKASMKQYQVGCPLERVGLDIFDHYLLQIIITVSSLDSLTILQNG
jgi:hypothetical protein